MSLGSLNLSTRPTASRYDPINRSIEEERRVRVLVRDNNVDQLSRC